MLFISQYKKNKQSIAPSISETGAASQMPFSPQKFGNIISRGINAIIWREALRIVDWIGFPIDWK